MTEEFLLWRCLHGGPISRDTIDQFPSDNAALWERCRNRNRPLLKGLIRAYGACAIVARHGDQIVGQLRFYPKDVCGMQSAGGLCLQADYPAGPASDFGQSDLPPREKLQDQTLQVHCLMTGSPGQEENPYQRKGVGTRMVRTLIQWARDNGWESIETNSFEDIPVLYEVTGCAGHTFWKKLGFHAADRFPDPNFRKHPDFILKIQEQANAAAIDPEKARDRLVMRLDLE